MKYILSSFLISFLLFSCTKPEEQPPVNQNPSRFSLNILGTGANHIYAKWEASEDPEGDNVFYDVYLNYQLYAQNIVATEMYFFPLDPESEYFIEINAKDNANGLVKKSAYAYTAKNNPPGNFSVSTNFIEANQAEITWSNAIDPDGTITNYKIYLGTDLVIEGTTETSFLFENLTSLTDYSGTVFAYDAYGGESASNFAFTTLSE